MKKVRLYIHKKKRVLGNVSFICALALATIITLASCAGLTHPCVSCQRDPASESFEKAEEVKWEDSGTDTDYEKGEKRKHSPRSDL